MTASSFGLAVFVMSVCAVSFPAIAQAEMSLRSGVSGSTILHPFADLNIAHDWVADGWTSDIEMKGRAATAKGSLGDASASADWHSEKQVDPSLLIELDALYSFDRDFDTTIEQSQSLGADLGFVSTSDAFTLKTDFGIFGRIHQDTQRPGLRALDRATEDFWEGDVAVRLTADSPSAWKPFIETALVHRSYRINTGRAFWGPDLIIGATATSPRLKGDAGILFASRKVSGEPLSTVVGPYVDLKWTPYDQGEIALDLSSGLDQDTTGDRRPFRFHEAVLTYSHSVSDQLKLSAVTEVLWEGRRAGNELEITPLLKFEWMGNGGFGAFAQAGFSYTKIEGDSGSFAPSLEAGIKLTLD